MDDVLEVGDLIIDHAVIPVRNLYSAAENRRDVTRIADVAAFPAEVPWGL
ncbi:MAG TPA: hypothetical protein VEW46_11195 [Pyrinomonadaceae bacterium]|nr:hypothetical protein [Pyrinomonadaceae bacterium]